MKSLLKRITGKKEPIILVSGLPRSGTSLMMKMLAAGGIPPMTDQVRTADDDNPQGYYEYERAKKLHEGDTAWLPEARGRAVKTISALLEHLPADFEYRVVFMRRAMPEILASQRQMLINRGEDPDKMDDAEMAGIFEAHLKKVMDWLAAQPNFSVLYINYNDLVADPEDQIDRLQNYFGGRLDRAGMTAVVDPELYRQRHL
ncbi:MAG TPA: sulfotransferase [Anaerolineales bacterium]|nr:sulfotransferase [Anaerolineales bacterium]